MVKAQWKRIESYEALCCPQCKLRLQGQGTKEQPFTCRCGEWLWDKEKKAYTLVEI